ncbi:MAG: hypothetical protein ACC654_07910 [Acidimicrobiia bacterium]
MSQATLDLIVSLDVLISVAIGSVLVFIVIGWAAIKHRSLDNGGLLIVGSAIVALVVTGRAPVPVWMVLGLVLLAAAGWVPTKTIATRMLTLIPGAAAIGASFLDSPQLALGAFVVVAIVLSGPFVAGFDERYRESAISTPLMAVSLLGAFVTIPDTDVAVIAAAAAVPWVFTGPPAKLVVLGRAGAFAATGFLVWVVASGGFSRSDALITGVATLALLIAEPAVRLFRSAERTRLDRFLATGLSGAVVIVVAQGVIVLILGQVIGGTVLSAVYAGVLAVALLAIAGIWATTPKPDG